MIILGIEGSANKIGVGITKNNEILSNPRVTFITPPGSGFVPTEVMLHHQKNILSLIKQALKEANLNLRDIDAIAYTKGPGMAGPLSVGALVARILSLKLEILIIPVNHCIAHIEMGKMVTGAENPVVLYASGGNTQIVTFQD